MTPAFPAKQTINLALIALLVWLHFGGGGVLPVAAGPISVLVVEETADRDKLTAGQLDIIGSNAPDGARAYLKTHGEPDPLRVVDKDDSLSQDDPKWQAAFAAKGATVPWLVIGRGGKVMLSEAMPADAAETMQTLKRFGGQ